MPGEPVPVQCQSPTLYLVNLCVYCCGYTDWGVNLCQGPGSPVPVRCQSPINGQRGAAQPKTLPPSTVTKRPPASAHINSGLILGFFFFKRQPLLKVRVTLGTCNLEWVIKRFKAQLVVSHAGQGAQTL